MVLSNEDWLIIDSALNDIAKSLRRIEREEQEKCKLSQQKVANHPLPSGTSLSDNASLVQQRVEDIA